MDAPPPTKEQVTALYLRMLEADHQYAEHQTQEHNQHINITQRAYYAALIRYNRAHYPQDEARFLNATALWRRAQQNRKRLPDNAVWQDLALHQYRRMFRIRSHAMGLWDGYKSHTQLRYEKLSQPQPAPKPPVTRRKRVVHPITGRYVFQEVTE